LARARGFAAQIRFEGVREVTRSLAKTDKEIGKGIARENKQIGQDVVDRATPHPLAVGAGAGAKPRAIASRNMVAIAAGGPHRKRAVQQWGRRVVPRSTPRPFLVGALINTLPDIQERYLAIIESAALRAGMETH
jgi:hypothetical protein